MNMENTVNPQDLFNQALTADRQGNLDEAFALIKNAAELRHPQAMYEYARRCYEGIGCERNADTAIPFFAKASYNGVLDATLFLERYYTTVVPDENKLPSLYRDGYKAGDPRFAYLHALEMLNKAKEVKDDVSEDDDDFWGFWLKGIYDFIMKLLSKPEENEEDDLYLQYKREAKEAYNFAISHGYKP